MSSQASTPSGVNWLDRVVGGPQKVRRLLEKRGPTFIKIGQFLAMRPDLLPQEYCAELMHLFDDVPEFPWATARDIIRADLGGDPADLFREVDARPIAAGSLAQTYVWRLASGVRVAVKVQRPGLRAQVLRDIRRARRLARLLEISGVPLIVAPRDAVEEIAGWLLQEIDFRRELHNLTRLYRLSRNSRHQVIPRPYPRLSGDRVVTARYLEGSPVSAIIRSPLPGEGGADERVSAGREQFAGNLFAAALTQMFRYRFFHADLHPGNLLIARGNRAGFVDFGLCADLDETIHAQQTKYLWAVYRGDAEQMYAAVIEILETTEHTDVERFRREFLAEARAWSTRRRAERQHGPDESPRPYGSAHAQFLIAAMRSARRNGFLIPSSILALYRALLTAESVSRQVAPTVDLGAVGREFFASLRVQEIWRRLRWENPESVLLSYITLLRDSPTQLNQILGDIASGRFALRVTVRDALDVQRAKNQRVRVLTCAILLVGVAVLLTAPELPAVLGLSLRLVIWALFLTTFALFAIEWRKLR